jgi:ABC-type multidrug transport system fused ATPase/permease subunit
MFHGSLRFNIDPVGEFTDHDICDALLAVDLLDFVETLPGRLDHTVSDNGENLSVGQRQLVCIARAILRKPKILIMDEATAFIDHDTDMLIQRTIRNVFKHATIVTIAHRLRTIMDYDRILVLEQGCVIEYGSPAELLSLHQKAGNLQDPTVNTSTTCGIFQSLWKSQCSSIDEHPASLNF